MTSQLDAPLDVPAAVHSPSDSAQPRTSTGGNCSIEPVQLPAAPILRCSSASPTFLSVHALLYAALRQPLRSKETLHISTAAILENPSNPSSWLLRRQSLNAISKHAWVLEYAFLHKVLEKSPKNYQAWEHRRFVAEHAGLNNEIQYVDIILANDAKNYHAWSHRAWVAKNGGEVTFEGVEWYIEDDVRNNSAWNHRWLLGALLGRQHELKFVKRILGTQMGNESLWNYVLALIKANVEVGELRELARDVKRRHPNCIGPRRILVLTAGKDDMKEVVEDCQVLIAVDPIREKYWAIQKQRAVQALGED